MRPQQTEQLVNEGILLAETSPEQLAAYVRAGWMPLRAAASAARPVGERRKARPEHRAGPFRFRALLPCGFLGDFLDGSLDGLLDCRLLHDFLLGHGFLGCFLYWHLLTSMRSIANSLEEIARLRKFATRDSGRVPMLAQGVRRARCAREIAAFHRKARGADEQRTGVSRFASCRETQLG